MAEHVRQKAYEIFQSRGSHGRALDDWLEAERNLIAAPEPEVLESDSKYEVRIPADGFEPGETTVTALPNALVVSAESHHEQQDKQESIRSCEFLYRRLEMPMAINPDRVTAVLDGGTLRIIAPKAETHAVQVQAAAAA